MLKQGGLNEIKDGERQLGEFSRGTDKRARRALCVLLASASGVLLAGCGGRGGEGGSTVRAALPMAPDFSFEVYQGEQELGGRELRLSDVVALGKPIILNFWAAWCAPCQVEMPEFQEYYDQHREQVLMLGVASARRRSARRSRPCRCCRR